mmetsp:Transcript_9392/g.34451  ORF Transcript_9392/g.34451 Transcript_9392/m.34451 type:complete len:254 (+) Transcript_9392:178-939(+)
MTSLYTPSQFAVAGPSSAKKDVASLSLGSWRPHAAGLKTSSRFNNRRSSMNSRRVVTMMPVGVPKVPVRKRGENVWQWTDLYNCLYQDRIIFVGQGIDEELGNTLVATMLFLDSEDQKPMSLYINCPGGDVVPTLAIHDTMRHVKSPVGTVGFGMCASMGGMLLACGDKGRRSTLPHTTIMLHQPSGAARGQASDMKNEADELLRLRKYIWGIFSEATGRPVEQVEQELARDRYFTPDEAMEYGLVDRVIRPR